MANWCFRPTSSHQQKNIIFTCVERDIRYQPTTTLRDQKYTPQKKFCTTYTVFFVFTAVQCTTSYFVQIIWRSCWFCNLTLFFEICIALFAVAKGWLLLDNWWFLFFIKLWESVTLPNVKKNVWNNTEIMYWYVETNTHIFEFTRQLVLKFQNSHFPQNFAKC